MPYLFILYMEYLFVGFSAPLKFLHLIYCDIYLLINVIIEICANSMLHDNKFRNIGVNFAVWFL